jgi:hypothetical protein
MMSGSTVLAMAKTSAPLASPPLRRLAIAVATNTAAAIEKRRRRPSAIRMPLATPAAGQNTATFSGRATSRRLNQADSR